MQQISQIFATIDAQTLAVTLGPALLIVVALVGYIVWQKRKIAKLEYDLKPKYGFLGKPLYSTLAAFIMLSAFGVTFLATQQSGNVVDVSANKKLEVQIQYKILGTKPGGYDVEFTVLPQINGKPWGENGQEVFDVFWRITGTTEASEAELSRSIAKPSQYRVILPNGNYTVKAEVFGDDVNKSQEINIRVP